MTTPIFLAESWGWRLVTSGGWPGIALLAVLLLLSLAALALTVEQLAVLRAGALVPEGLAARVRKLLEGGDLPAARKACAGGGVLGTVLSTALEEASELAGVVGWATIEKTMEDATAAESARLMRRVEYLAVIGNLAPMVGLLGTVVGMIFAFREVAETQGAATAGELAAGIYQALVTTVGGLLVAIPSLGVHALLRNRVDTIMGAVVADAEAATRPLKRALHGRSV